MSRRPRRTGGSDQDGSTPEPGAQAFADLAPLIGRAEARRHALLWSAWRAAESSGGGPLAHLELLEPAGSGSDAGEGEGAGELAVSAGWRPGLIAFAGDGAGNHACWDLRRGPTPDPAVLWCEDGVATPLAAGSQLAVVRLLLQQLVFAEDQLGCLERWLGALGTVVGREGRRLLLELRSRAAWAARGARAARAGGAKVFTAGDERRLGRTLAPPGRPGWATLPPTAYPLLDPTDDGERREALGHTRDSVRLYRELTVGEGRAGFRWHLAAALRSEAHLGLGLGELAAAARAGRQAAGIYEALLGEGELRVRRQLVFVHHLLAEIHGRLKRPALAWKHARRALDLGEDAALESDQVQQALQSACLGLGLAWRSEREGRAGRRWREEGQLRLRNAARTTGPWLEPAGHPQAEVAADLWLMATLLEAAPDAALSTQVLARLQEPAAQARPEGWYVAELARWAAQGNRRKPGKAGPKSGGGGRKGR